MLHRKEAPGENVAWLYSRQELKSKVPRIVQWIIAMGTSGMSDAVLSVQSEAIQSGFRRFVISLVFMEAQQLALQVSRSMQLALRVKVRMNAGATGGFLPCVIMVQT